MCVNVCVYVCMCVCMRVRDELKRLSTGLSEEGGGVCVCVCVCVYVRVKLDASAFAKMWGSRGWVNDWCA